MTRLCYQLATPDVPVSEQGTSYHGAFEASCRTLASFGYDGVELMTIDPERLNRERIKAVLERYGLTCTMVCTGEIYGYLGLSYTDPSSARRAEAVRRTKSMIDFAADFGANINIGRVRGRYTSVMPPEQTEEIAIRTFRELSAFAASAGVKIVLEPVTILQTNFLNTLSETWEMVHRVDRSNFGMMLDVFHTNLEEKDLYDAIRMYGKDVLHVHLADNNRRYPGQCGLQFRKILELFHESGYQGDFTVEICQLPDMNSAARGAAEHLRPIIAEVYGGK